jgi:hypothetical protein
MRRRRPSQCIGAKAADGLRPGARLADANHKSARRILAYQPLVLSLPVSSPRRVGGSRVDGDLYRQGEVAVVRHSAP